MKQLLISLCLCLSFQFCFSQISYQSEVIKGNSYVQPYDLSIMERVNAQKQEEFYKNANALKQRFKNCFKWIDYVPTLNRSLVAGEYNALIDYANGNDLSQRSVVNFLNSRINNLENVIDYAIKHPNVQLTTKVFE